MALLAIDSFDHYATADLAARGWSPSLGSAGGTATINATGRNSTSSLRLVVSSSLANNFAAASKALPSISGATCIVGFAYNQPTLVTIPIVSVFAGAGIQVILSVTSTGALTLGRASSAGTPTTGGAQTNLITTAPLITAATWAYIELKVTFADAGGAAEIKVNGTSAGTFSGDTAGNNVASWSGLLFGININHSLVHTRDIDDVYVCDGSTGSNNTFLGDHRMIAIVASAGNGSHTAWTPSTGTDHGALVDEATPNTSDYVSTGTVNAIDTFNFAALGVAGTVKAVQTVNYLKCDVAGLRTVAPAFRIGGADYVGSGVLIPADWVYVPGIHLTNPATAAAWTVADIDAAEFGVKVTV